MRRLPAILVGSFALVAAAVAADAPGRWQGLIRIPGRDVHATVDLDRDAGGAWIGSVTAPELQVQGAPLAAIELHDATVAFAIRGVLAPAPDQPARFEGRLEADRLVGTFTQAGNSAPFELRRSGAAQVDLPPASTAVAAELEGAWTGDYELMGYSRHVTLRLANHAGKPASAEFVIVGKKTNNLPVDFIAQDGDFLRVESHDIGINLDGRFRRDAGEIAATYQQGPFEVPFVLRRSTEKTP